MDQTAENHLGLCLGYKMDAIALTNQSLHLRLELNVLYEVLHYHHESALICAIGLEFPPNGSLKL